MATQKKRMLKSLKVENKSKTIGIRLSAAEYSILKDKAATFANGQVSEWIRYAALNFEPSDDDLA
jgi:hypothetical protein